MNEGAPQLLKSHCHLPGTAQPCGPQLPVWARHPAECTDRHPQELAARPRHQSLAYFPTLITPVGGCPVLRELQN